MAKSENYYHRLLATHVLATFTIRTTTDIMFDTSFEA